MTTGRIQHGIHTQGGTPADHHTVPLPVVPAQPDPADPTVDATAIVLTGGGPAPAALCRVGGLTVLERAVRALSEAGLRRVLVHSPDGPDGPVARLVRGRGLAAGWQPAGTAPAPADRVLLVAGDQVFDPGTAARLLAEPPGTVRLEDGGLAILDADAVAPVLAGAAAPASGPPGSADALVAAVDRLPAVRRRAAGRGLAATLRGAGDVGRVERLLWHRYGPKPTDGLAARYLNRPLSRPVTLWLLRTRLTPDALTGLSFLLVLAGAAVLGLGGTWWARLVGGVLVAAGNALDGVDGEVARISLRTSRRGALLDTVLDRYADLAVLAGLALAAGGRPAHWAWAFAAGGAAMLIPYINALSPAAPRRLLRRDVRLLLCALAAAMSLPLWGLVLVAVVGNLDAARVFFLMIRRSPGPS